MYKSTMAGDIIRIYLFLLISVLHIPVYAQQHEISKHSLLITSKSLANQMGKIYQLAQNCDQELTSIAATRVAALFRNYFESKEVTTILKQYKYAMAEEKGKSCNYEAIKTHRLMNKIADYMRMAAPFAHR